MARVLTVALVTALTVAGVDLFIQTSLSRYLWPVVLSPPDGGIETPPVRVRWEGPQPMLAVVRRGSQRLEMGLRSSPFEIDPSAFPRPGQYRLELTSPRFGSVIRAERRFFVRPPAEAPPAEPPPPPAEESRTLDEELTRLREERDRIEADAATLREDNARLERENQDLTLMADELQAEHDQLDERVGVVESQNAELLQRHLEALRANELMQARIEGLPACTTWGYVSAPRSASPVRRVVVSNGRGQVFRSEADCRRARDGDPTAASACICVGSVWD